MHNAIIRLLIVALFVCASGCGYVFQGGGSILPPDVKVIAIPIVENDSTEGGLANVLTEALRDQFERYGIVRIVEDEQDGDAVLNTRIKSVKRTTRSVTSNTDVALQFDATMVLSVSLIKRNGAVLYRNDNLSVSSQFGAARGAVVSSSSDFAQGVTGSTDLARLDPRQLQRSQEQQALERVAYTAAQRVYQGAVAPDF